jgi:hypothetical protein
MGEIGYGRVRRRRVFYIPGYDPVPARRYREIYRREGAEQARISGYSLALHPRHEPGSYGWHVEAEIDGSPVAAEFDVLVWSDIVKTSMAHGVAATYLQLARTAWAYIGSGALARLMRLRKGPVIAALYPVVMLLAQLFLAGLAGWALGWLIALALPWEAGAVAGVALALVILRGFQRLDRRLYAHYLMHDYAFSARLDGENPEELEARMAEFREAIAEALQSDVDEVLVVGHSSGAHLAISVLADLIRRGEVPDAGPALSLLTLGQVVPMVSFLPRAWRLRDDLHYLAARRELAWVDVTAPGDGCAFALCDPVAVSGVAPKEKYWPLVFSAAFSRTLSRKRWRRLRWRFFRLHFQYIHAFDQPGDYDYFRVTAGPLTLGARYAGRAASKSRIERAVSPYTSRAA